MHAHGTPFRFGEIVGTPYFTDREQESEALRQHIFDGLNVVVISPRRYGKTSLILRVLESVQRDAALVAYVDLLRTPTKERFADHLAGAIYSGLVAPFDRAVRQATELAQRLPLRPRITLGQDGSPSFEFSAGASAERDIDATLEHLLSMPGDIARQRSRRVVLVLDEFQEIVGLDPHLPALLRSVFQTQAEVAHIFLGSRQHALRHVFTDANQPLYRLALPMALGSIASDKFMPFLRERFAAGGSQITRDGLNELLTLTAGHPNDTQELGHYAWALARAEGAAATAEIVRRALDQALDAEDARFTELWEGLSGHQRIVLASIALEPGVGLYGATVRDRLRLGPASQVQRSVKRLVERELVEPQATGYHVPDVFLRGWLHRMRRLPLQP